VRRLPVVAFATLAVATIAAFFIVQHLKSNGTLIVVWNGAAPFSDNGDGCRSRTSITFNLQDRADSVSVFVLDSEGDVVRTVASGVAMQAPKAGRRVRRTFYWHGREDSGRLAANGSYYFRVTLDQQGRYVDLTQDPIVVDNTPAYLVVRSVSPSQLPAPGGVPATVHFTGSRGRGGYLLVYRTAATGAPQLATVRAIPFSKPSPSGYTKTWNGLISGRPAPAGTYVMALKVTNRACVTGTFPVYLPPRRGTTANAGLTIQYLAAEPPLDPIPAGSPAVVGVAANHERYRWTLRRVGSTKRRPARSGSGSSTSLRVRLPGGSAGLYELTIRADGHETAVPLAGAAPAGSGLRVLVVLPALTWQGLNQVDDNGDGFPDTLVNGGPIGLERVLAAGLPAGFGGQAGLLSYLDRAGLPYDLTTDVALATGVGPKLADYTGVVFAGPAVWLPASLAPALKTYIEQGGRVLSLGVGSLQRTATVHSTAAGLQALAPSAPSATDVLGAHSGPLIHGNTYPIVVSSDRLGIFSGTSGTFAGFGSFAPIPAVAAPGGIMSAAGTTAQAPSIVGYRLGSGIVVDVGLPTFTTSLAHNVDTQELVRRLWTVLRRGA
jgi:hypothetical protein